MLFTAWTVPGQEAGQIWFRHLPFLFFLVFWCLTETQILSVNNHFQSEIIKWNMTRIQCWNTVSFSSSWISSSLVEEMGRDSLSCWQEGQRNTVRPIASQFTVRIVSALIKSIFSPVSVLVFLFLLPTAFLGRRIWIVWIFHQPERGAKATEIMLDHEGTYYTGVSDHTGGAVLAHLPQTGELYNVLKSRWTLDRPAAGTAAFANTSSELKSCF